MQFSFSALVSLSLIASVMGHARMAEPEQWKSGPDVLAPLKPDGSDFPCQNAQNEASPDVINTPSATWVPGEQATLKVVGGATHGGGSGQMVFTYDLPPTANSVWRVLHSWEGDHPVKADGNTSGNPDEEHPPIFFEVPAELRAGKGTAAWNWFNRIGNREHYMKCATVEIKSDGASSSSYDGLPTAFRANSLGESPDACKVAEGTNAINFHINNPKYVTIAPGAEPVEVPCGLGSSGSTGGSSGSEETPAAPSATSPTVPPSPTAAPEQGQEEDDNSESGSGDSEELPSKPTEPVASPSPVTQPTQPEPENKGTSGACTEGETVCTEGNTWSQCGSGRMQNMGLVPAGLKCEGGKLIVKRSIRFSAEHRRHRVRHA